MQMMGHLRIFAVCWIILLWFAKEGDAVYCNGFGPSQSQADAGCGGSGQGTCVSTNNCECTSSYTGTWCQTPICFGYSSSGSVCSGRGSCSSPDTCTCNDGYTGEKCQYYICYGTAENDSPCSSQGTCVGVDNCDCDDGYTGSRCQYYTCDGISSTSDSVCSGNGNCFNVDSCSCRAGYGGQFCQFPICNNIRSDDDSVCNGRGTCTNPDHCLCDNTNQYTGNDCQYNVCYGKSEVSPSVCTERTTRGSCTAPDTCDCTSLYFGDECEKTTCDGISSETTDTVCSGKGDCIAYDECSCREDGLWGNKGDTCDVKMCNGQTLDQNPCGDHGTCTEDPNNKDQNYCECDSGYSGTLCENIICNGKETNVDPVSEICNGRGTCTAPDTCVDCDYGWTGDDCEIRQCSGVDFDDPNVCSSRGDCVASNTCDCYDGWRSSECEIKTCGVYDYNQDGVCNGHGTCNPSGAVATGDTCDCDTGYGGPLCAEWYCDGIVQSNSSVCSSHGTCVDGEQCDCDSGYGGTYCSIYSCDNILSTHPSVCSEHGDCVAFDDCSCDEGYTGNVCDIPICYGIAAYEDNVCSGDGTCENPDQCLCDAGHSGQKCEISICYETYGNDPEVCSSHGSCVDTDSCACDVNWRGSECSIPVCNGKRADDDTVCSGNGVCVYADDCDCNSDPLTGYVGDDCERPLCFGDPDCSNHGTCQANHTCACDTSWTGNTCDIPTCFGVNSTDTDHVCGGGKGTCISADTCDCNDWQYTGANCTQPGCYGVEADDPLICNGYGNCTAVDTCECPTDSGYYNSRCEPTSCFGKSFGVVCSDHGECVEKDVCDCDAGWTGLECSIPICGDFLANDTSNVCSSTPDEVKGICVAPDQCDCAAGLYSGSLCQYAICYSVDASSQWACSGHGDCTEPNHCDCDTAWFGVNCQLPSCDGIVSTNQSVCSSRGDCLNVDICNCAPHTTGQFCEVNVCDGMTEFEDNVCSGHGSCIDANLCDCEDSWGADVSFRCNVSTCDQILATDPNVCSGHGECFPNSICKCEFKKYGGDICQYAFCYDILASNETVCSGHGSCASPDHCLCDQDWTSSMCDVPICFGINATDDRVCSGHGDCIDPNQCICDPSEYVGGDCSIPVCFDIPAINTSVCTGNGSCIAPDTCNCTLGFTEDGQCRLPVCYGFNSTDPNVCSSSGWCFAPDECLCDSESFGDECQYDLCYGIPSNDNTTCSSHGNCTGYNTCSCLDGLWTGDECEIAICYDIRGDNSSVCSTHGACVGPDICDCDDKWTGEHCDMPICFNFNASHPQTCSGRGECIYEDTCVCEKNDLTHPLSYWEYDYLGPNCNVSVCYNVLATDSLVCSGRGVCVGPNNCTCTNRLFAGENCEEETCFGIGTRSPDVCSSNGRCLSRDVCSCDDGYVGEACSLPVCGFYNSSSSKVCSTHGECVTPDECICDPNWNGPLCEFHMCYNVSSNSTLQCSGHGECESVNNCICSDAWSGSNCQYPICFGIPSNNESVCSGHGECTGVDHCECLRDPFFNELVWNGTYCNETAERFCFGYSIVDPHVCQGHGACDFERCDCFEGYTDFDCRFPICFGKSDRVGPAPCSGNGQCVAPNNCSCYDGYVGKECDSSEKSITCFGFSADDKRVCNSHGTCVTNDTCQCNHGWQGDACQYQNCFGTSDELGDFSICSGHGRCTGGICICDDSFFGRECETWTCNGTDQTQPSVCSGHGDCISPNTCECDDLWEGRDCSLQTCTTEECVVDSDECPDGFAGDDCSDYVCFGQLGDDSCSGNGLCASPSQCVCDLGFTGIDCSVNITSSCPSTENCDCPNTGMHPSSRCQTCLVNYYPEYNCTKYCSPTTTCHGHGSCNQQGNCDCDSSLSRGYWNEEDNCKTCRGGFYGSSCQQVRFVWNSKGSALRAPLSVPENVKIPSRVDCSTILGSSTLGFFGDNPYCMWSDETDISPLGFLEIRLGSNPKILPFSNQRVEIDPTGNRVFSFIDIEKPDLRVRPTAIVDRPDSNIGSCQDVSLRSYSILPDPGKEVEYVWSVSGFQSDRINQWLQRNDANFDSKLFIPFNVDKSDNTDTTNQTVLFHPDFTYNVSLKVISQFGGEDTVVFPIRRSFEPKVRVDIRGTPTQKFYAGSKLFLSGSASFDDECAPFAKDEEIVFSWKQTSGPYIEPSMIAFSGQNGRFLTISPHAFSTLYQSWDQKPFEIGISLSAFWDKDKSSMATDRTTITVHPKPVERVSMGIHVQANTTLIFDTFKKIIQQRVTNLNTVGVTWKCKACSSSIKSALQRANIENNLSPEFIVDFDEAVLHAQVIDRFKYGRYDMIAYLESSNYPTVLSMPRSNRFVVNPQRNVVFDRIGASGSISTMWNVYLLDSASKQIAYKLNLEDVIDNQPAFSVPSSRLLQNQTYRVKVSSQFSDQVIDSWSDIFVPPLRKSGMFTVSPISGIAMQTPFAFEASFFDVSPDSSNVYSFGYLDPETKTRRTLIFQSRESLHYNVFLPVTDESLTVYCIVEGGKYGTYSYQEVDISTSQIHRQRSLLSTIQTERPDNLYRHLFANVQDKEPDRLIGDIQLMATYLNRLEYGTADNCMPCTNDTVCPCQRGYQVFDCDSLSHDDFALRRALRDSLTQTLIQINTLPFFSNNDFSFVRSLNMELLQIFFDTVKEIKHPILETSSASVELLFHLVDSLSDSLSMQEIQTITSLSSSLLDQLSGNYTYSRCSSVLTHPVEWPSEYQRMQYEKLVKLARWLLDAVLDETTPGSAPSYISADSIELIGFSISGRTVDIPDQLRLIIEENTLSQSRFMKRNTDDDSFYTSASLLIEKYDPFGPFNISIPSNRTLVSRVMTLQMQPSRTVEFEAKLPASIDLSMINFNMSTSGTIVACKYLSSDGNSFDSDWSNCTVDSFNETSVTCYCSADSSTDLMIVSAFLEQYNPIISIDPGVPIVVILPIDYSNYTTTGVMSGVVALYIIFLIVINLCECCNTWRLTIQSKKVNNKKIDSKLGKINRFLGKSLKEKKQAQVSPDPERSSQSSSDEDDDAPWNESQQPPMNKSEGKKSPRISSIQGSELSPITPKGEELDEESDIGLANLQASDSQSSRLRELLEKTKVLDDMDVEDDMKNELSGLRNQYFVNLFQPEQNLSKKKEEDLYEPDTESGSKQFLTFNLLMQQLCLSHIWLGLLYIPVFCLPPTHSLIKSYYFKFKHLLSKSQRLSLILFSVSSMLAFNTVWYTVQETHAQDTEKSIVNFLFIGILSAFIPSIVTWVIYSFFLKSESLNHRWIQIMFGAEKEREEKSENIPVEQVESKRKKEPEISDVDRSSSSRKSSLVVPDDEAYARDLVTRAKHTMDTVHFKSGLFAFIGISILLSIAMAVGAVATSQVFFWEEHVQYLSITIFLVTSILIYITGCFLIYLWAKVNSSGANRRTICAHIVVSLLASLVLFGGSVAVITLFSINYEDDFYATGLPYAILGTIALLYTGVLFLMHTIVQCLPIHRLANISMFKSTILSSKPFIPRFLLAIPYLFIYMWSAVAFFLCVFYGLSFEREIAVNWVYSSLVSLFVDIVVVCPMLFVMWHAISSIQILVRILFLKSESEIVASGE